MSRKMQDMLSLAIAYRNGSITIKIIDEICSNNNWEYKIDPKGGLIIYPLLGTVSKIKRNAIGSKSNKKKLVVQYLIWVGNGFKAFFGFIIKILKAGAENYVANTQQQEKKKERK